MNILTIDLEDWFHILDLPSVADRNTWGGFESRVEANADRILAVLEEKNVKATWFCLGWIVNKYPALVNRIAAKHDVACHSMYHQLLFQQDPRSTKDDIRENIHSLEDLTGKKVTAYRAPGFSFTKQTKWLIEILAEAGIIYDCSLFPAARNHGGFDGFPSDEPCRISYKGAVLREFPMSTISFTGRRIAYSGGGYFRLLPYSVINGMIQRSDYTMTYFHPRDFDAGQPILPGLSAKRKFMSYIGLKNSFSKFNRLLNDHKFVTVDEAGSRINWEQKPLIQIDDL